MTFFPTWGEAVAAHKQEYPHFEDNFSDKMPKLFDDVYFQLHKSSDVSESSHAPPSLLPLWF